MEEKERIRRILIEQARQLFAAHGLKKTSIEDLTKAAGIAQGSFYLFFPSKEELFVYILKQEEDQIRSTLIERFFTSGPIKKADFKQFLHESFSVMENNPFIRQLHTAGTLEILTRKIPEDKWKEYFEEDTDYLRPFIIHAQKQGWMIEKHPDTITSLIRSIVLLTLQKRQIGEDHYQATIDLLIDLISEGLIREVT